MSQFTRRTRRDQRDLAVIALLTLVAFGLRLADLTARSLWLDEGFSLIRVFGPWSNLWRNIVPYDGMLTIDTNPQVYFALLKTWGMLAGTSEFALKWVSAAAGTMCVPLGFAVARRLISRQAAAVAALLLACSPVVQWYSHELRMYTVVVVLSALSLFLLHRALVGQSGRAWLAWVVCLAVGLLTHYSFIGLVLAQVGYVAVWFVARPNAPRIQWCSVVPIAIAGLLLGGGVAVAVGLPTLLQRLTSGAEYSFQFVPLNTVVQSIVGQTLFGLNTTDPTDSVFTWLVFAVCVVGTIAQLLLRPPPQRASVALLAACLVVPVLVWFGISFIKPNFHNVRHLILVVPPFLILLAGALDLVWTRLPKPLPRLIATAAFASVLAAQADGMWFAFARTPDWQDDWRALTQYIRDHWQPGDAVIENAGTPSPITRLYLGNLPVTPQRLAEFDGLPAADVTQRLAAQHPRIWFINTGGRALAEGEGQNYLRSFTQIDQATFGGRTIGLNVLLLKTSPPFVRDLPTDAIRIGDPNAMPTSQPIAAYSVSPGNVLPPTQTSS